MTSEDSNVVPLRSVLLSARGRLGRGSGHCHRDGFVAAAAADDASDIPAWAAALLGAAVAIVLVGIVVQIRKPGAARAMSRAQRARDDARSAGRARDDRSRRAFLGIGAMVGAGIFALLGEAGAVAGSAVWFSFLSRGSWPACSATPSSSSASAIPPRADHRLPGRGVRQRSAGRDRVVAGLRVRHRDRLRHGRRVLRQLRHVAVRRGRRRAGWDNFFTTLVVLGAWGSTSSARAWSIAPSRIVVALLAVFAVFIAVTITDVNWSLLASAATPTCQTSSRASR